MAKLKDFFRSKSGKITISIIAAIVVAASISAIITIKHKSKIDNNKIAETKKAQQLSTEKRDEAIKEAELEEKKAEAELEKAKNSGNNEDIENAKAKVSKAREKSEKAQNKAKGTKSTNSSANQKNSANKPSKPSNGGSNKPNKPNKPSKPEKKETLAQEIARIKQEIRSGYSVPVKFMDRLITKTEYYNDSIVNIVDEWADRQGISGFGYSTRQLSNGKFLVYLHHFTYKK